jgi:hypothetical protein
MHKTLAFLLFLLPGLALGQGRVSGVVQDSATHQALAFSSVFLANTTLGATTDEQGRFEFPKVPAGSYEIVGSYVGYRLSKQPITVGKAAAPQQVTLLLGSSGPQLGEVVVEANPHREEDFKKFTTYFLGESTFSQQCRILNPKDIVVYTNDSTKELTAAAKNFVEVENQALGYKLKFFGMFFTYNPETGDVGFSGEPVFEEMKPQDEAQRKKWAANRLAAYVGSPWHFTNSVYTNTLKANGFLVQKVRIQPNPLFERLAQLKRRPSTALSASQRDSLRRNVDVPPVVATLYPAALPLDSIRQVTTDGRVFLHFRDELQVTHFGEAPDANYPAPMATLGPEPAKKPYPAQRQVSRLVLLKPRAEIEQDGSLLSISDVSTNEYWGFERVGEFLPFDYVPPAPAK